MPILDNSRTVVPRREGNLQTAGVSDIPTHLGPERTARIPRKPEGGVQELAAGCGTDP